MEDRKVNINNDSYADFADKYDLFFAKFGEHNPALVDFFRKLFENNQVNDVLDCACGTGQDLHLIHSLGCNIFGFDISESMLTQARKNLTQCDLTIPLSKVDYRELHKYYTRQFDAVVCLSTSIGEMPNEQEVIRAFKSMHKVLRDGGILVLTQGTTDKQWNEKPRFIPMVNTSDFSRICVIDYFEWGVRYNILDIYHSNENRDFKVWSIDYTQMLLKDDQDRLLGEVGFSTVDFYGSYNFDPYDKKVSDRLITIATK
ncbi:class I SAM-dependent methyltransferase [Chloroflexota bacterium]